MSSNGGHPREQQRQVREQQRQLREQQTARRTGETQVEIMGDITGGQVRDSRGNRRDSQEMS